MDAGQETTYWYRRLVTGINTPQTLDGVWHPGTVAECSTWNISEGGRQRMEFLDQFDIGAFKQALSDADLEVDETDEVSDSVYVMFKNSRISHIKAPLHYIGRYNCINIYHGQSTKNGYWWDGKLDYHKLVEELKQYA